MDETMNVYQAITEVSRRIGGLAKEGFNQHQNYSFRGIDQLVTAVQPVLNELGVTIIPTVLSHNSEDRIADKISRWCTVEVKYTIVGPNGDTTYAIMVGEATDTSDKAMNKALSNAAKYFYFQTFWFGIGGMDEGDNDHIESRPIGGGQPAPRPQQQQQPRPAAPQQSRPASAPPAGGGISEPQQKKVWAMAHKSLNWDDVRMFQQIEIVTGRMIPDLASLTKSEASKVIDDLQTLIDNNQGEF